MDASRDPDKALPPIEYSGTGRLPHEYGGSSYPIFIEDEALNIEKAKAEVKWNNMDQGETSPTRARTSISGNDLYFKQEKESDDLRAELEAGNTGGTDNGNDNPGDTAMEHSGEESRRLNVDEEPNHKRTSPNPQFKTPTQLQAANANFEGTRKRPRPHSEEPSEEPCSKRRRLLYLDILGRYTFSLNDEARKMLRESPRKKRHEHSTDYRARVGSHKAALGGRASSVPLGNSAATIDDSDDSNQNDGEVLSAKRVRPNTTKQSNALHNSETFSPYFQQQAHGEPGQAALAADTVPREGKRTKPNVLQELVQHNSEIERASSSSPEPEGHAYAGSQTGGDGKGNVQEPRKPTETGAAPAPVWAFSNRYRDQRRDRRHRQSSENSTSAPKPSERQSAPMKHRIPGGLKPINRLSTISVEIPPLRTKDKPNWRYSHSGHLESNTGEREQSPPKRRRINEEGVKNRVSSPSVIELDPDSPPSRTHRDTSSVISASQSHEQQAQRRSITSVTVGQVGEFLGVEAIVKPQNQKSRNKTSQIASQRDGRSLGNEDQDDPISDGESIRAGPSKHSVPRVEIPYKGTSFQAPPRRTTKVCSDSRRPPRDVLPDSHQDIDGKIVKKRRLDPSSADQDDDLEIDDLATDHYINKGNALAEKKPATERSAATTCRTNMNGEQVEKFSVVEESSGDDISNSTADIKPTEFNKAKQIPKPNGTKYTLRQIFSEVNKWLVDDAVRPWTLNFKKEEERDGRKDDVLEVIDSNGVAQFDILARTINKIEFDRKSAKTIIHRSHDLSKKHGHLIHLELPSADDSRDLRDQLKQRHSSIGCISKTNIPGYLDKTFQATKERMPSQVGNPTDISLLQQKARKARQQRLHEPEQSKRADKTPISNNTRRAAREKDVPRAKGLAKSMKTNSAEPAMGDGVCQPEIGPSNFYGTSESSRQPASPATRSSRRVAEKDSVPQQRPKSRSATPMGWTRLHPDWADKWYGTLVYPPEGRNKANVDLPDIERLDEGEFLNDSLINFYIRWLQHGLESSRPELANRIYFQNSYFYERLTSLPKGRRGINYEAVRRWTAKVDLFEKDYIVVPVCENLHWYVAIICNAPRLLNPEPDIEAVPETSPVSVSEKPSPETVDGVSADRHTETITAPKPASSPPSPSNTSLSEANLGVDRMSLQDRPRDASEHSWPDENLHQGASTQHPAGLSSPIPTHDGAAEHTAGRPHDEPTAKVVSDLPPPQAKKSNMRRKGKRVSVGRKYDPNDPRIITLDSLGSSHSPTCTNLKDYLLAELKAKHGKEIQGTLHLGMTAKNIPEQHNFSDCGLFLLSYVEKFLESPDDFIRGILKNQHDVDIEWPKASEMRDRIRKLLFKLQVQQFGETKKAQESNRKDKDPERLAAKAEKAFQGKSTIHEVSTGGRQLDHVENPSLDAAQPLQAAPSDSGTKRLTEKQHSPSTGVLLAGHHRPKDGFRQPPASEGSVSKGTSELLAYMSMIAAENGQGKQSIKDDMPKSGKSEPDVVELDRVFNRRSRSPDFQQEHDGLPNGLERIGPANETRSRHFHAKATTRSSTPSSPELIEPNLGQSSQQLPELSSRRTLDGADDEHDAEMLFSGRNGMSQGTGRILRSSTPNSPTRERHPKKGVWSPPSSPVSKRLKSSPRIKERMFAASRDSSDSAVVGRHTRFSP